MKKFSSLILLVLSCVLWAQKVLVDTTQVVVSGRKNNIGVNSTPYVIMISADGFRYDYAHKYSANHLLKLSSSGVQAKALIPSYPSITFPNHWSLITGLYPSHHGLVANNFYDYKLKKKYSMRNVENAEDGSWYGGIPLWSLAEKQGLLSASLQWVGSASDAGGFRPTYYYHYHQEFKPLEKVYKVINWLKLPEEQRPHFITLYFPEVDTAGHHFGPDSKQTKDAVYLVDEAVGKLAYEVNKLGLKNVNFIFVSDHGMIKLDDENFIEIPNLLYDKKRFDFYNSQTMLRIYVKNASEVKSVYIDLKKNKTNDYEVYLDKKFPKYLHFSTKDDYYNRIGQIILVPKSSKIFLENGKNSLPGIHGFDPKKIPEMKATFIAWGSAFKNNFIIDEFENVNIYPLVTKILGLKINEKIDGDFKILKSILRDKNQ